MKPSISIPETELLTISLDHAVTSDKFEQVGCLFKLILEKLEKCEKFPHISDIKRMAEMGRFISDDSANIVDLQREQIDALINPASKAA
jgi:hypothetical protein